MLGNKNNDQNSISASQKLEQTVLDLVKSGSTTKDVGGDKSTREFTKQFTDSLSL